MASFTDQIQSFTPYTPEQPVEALVRVGMEKQRMYDEGVQTINAALDNTAALPIAKQPVKQYLQQKLNDVKKQISGGIASDFSNQRLVNHITGLTKQVSTDPVIQNGVASTMRYQKAATDVEQAKKEGKWAPENEWDVMSKAYQWMNDGDVSTSFDASYTPYTDVYKKAGEVFKQLHESGTIDQIPWVKDPKTGETDYRKTAAATLEKGIEGISGETIRNALRGALNEQDINQLGISGRYRFKDYTPQDLFSHTEQKFKEKRKDIDDTIAKLEAISKLNASNPPIKNKADERIKELKLYRDGDDINGIPSQLLTQELKEKQFIENNPDAAKAEIYKDAFIDQFSSAFSWEKSYRKYVKNEFKAQENWEKEYAIDRAKLALSQRSQWWEEISDQKGWDFKELELRLKKIELGVLDEPISRVGGIDLPGVTDSVSALEQSVVTADNNYTKLVADIAGSENLPIDAVAAAIEDYDKNGKLSFGNAKYKIPIDNALNAKRNADKAKIALAKALTEAKNDPTIKEKLAEIGKTFEGKKSYTFKVGNTSFIFTPEELVKLRGIIEDVSKFTSQKGLLPKSIRESGEKAIIDKVSGKYKLIIDEYLKNPGFRKKTDEATKEYGGFHSEYQKSQKVYGDEFYKIYKQKALQYAGQFAPTDYTWLAGKGEDKATRQQIAAFLADRTFAERGGNEGGDAEEIRSILLDESGKNAQVNVRTVGAETYLLVTPEGGEKTQALKLTPDVAFQIRSRVGIPQFGNSDFKQNIAVGGGNTNMADLPELSFYRESAFPMIKNTNVRADAQLVGGTDDRYDTKIRVLLPGVGWKDFYVGDIDGNNKYTTEEGQKIFLSGLTIESIKQMAKKALPSYSKEIDLLK